MKILESGKGSLEYTTGELQADSIRIEKAARKIISLLFIAVQEKCEYPKQDFMINLLSKK
jgi:hypothetical protein